MLNYTCYAMINEAFPVKHDNMDELCLSLKWKRACQNLTFLAFSKAERAHARKYYISYIAQNVRDITQHEDIKTVCCIADEHNV